MVLRRRSRTRVLSALVVAALAVASCGGDDDSSEGNTTEPTDGTEQAPPTGDVPGTTIGADVGEPVSGGVAVVRLTADIRGFDPVTFRGAQQQVDSPRAAAVFDVLMYEMPSGEVVRQIAESMETEDGIVWTLKVRDGVQFSDGTPFDAEAIKFNWERVLDPANNSPALSVAEAITDLTVVDPLTLQITLAAPQGQFDRVVALYLTHIGSPTAIEADPAGFAEHPVGAGPFILEEWVHDDRATLVRNPNYWNAPRPYLDGVEFRVIPDDTQAFNSVASGEIHASRSATPSDDRKAADAGLEVQKNLLNGGSIMIFNNATPPFDDVRARKAFSMAIDVDQLIATAYEGDGEPALTMFGEESPFYADIPLWSYDPAAAQALFDEVAAETGEPVAFTLSSTQGTRNVRSIEYMQAVLSAFQNVSVDVQTKDTATMIADVSSGNYQAGFYADNFGDPEPQFYNRYLSTSGGNISKFADPEMDAALEIGHTSLDPEERHQAYLTVQAIVAEQVPSWYFARLPQGWVKSPELEGLVVFFDGNLLLDGAWLAAE